MVRLMTSVNTIRQRCLRGKRKATKSSRLLKDSRNMTTHRECQIAIGWTEYRADIWTTWQMKIGCTLPLRARDNDTKTTGSWLSTRKDYSHGRGENNPPILPTYQTRQWLFQERYQERQCKWHTWSDSPFSLSAWTGSQSYTCHSKHCARHLSQDTQVKTANGYQRRRWSSHP